MSKKEKKSQEDSKSKSYTIEFLEEEISDLEDTLALTEAKLQNVITENDRLILRYEPYRPPGDENEGLDFYELIEENDSLIRNIANKIDVIRELDQEIVDLNNQIIRFVEENRQQRIELSELKNAVAEIKPKQLSFNHLAKAIAKVAYRRH